MLPDARFADYNEAMLTMRAEAQRKLALQDFRAPRPSEINKVLEENDVASVEDLRALMVEQLEDLQRWLKGSETDPLDAFYDGEKRVDENTARNRIVDQLQGQMKALGLSIVIERHMAGGNRCDITASAILEGRNRLLVTEVKGQWNNELYTAAAAQWIGDTRFIPTLRVRASISRCGLATAKKSTAWWMRASRRPAI